MGRLLAVSYRQYRGHDLEIRDEGGQRHQVIIHPPRNRGEPMEVPQGDTPMLLSDLVRRAKDMIDGVMGPRPAPRFGHGPR